ncbi:MAG: hypothetical protein OXF88_06370 [Rhodobacteraceae bacterium]|nr:hypothetical protein [Paracoccaceae bacterium]MCY4137005.1 hypothetical protein [Paracoccaceae bacterium]
MALALDFQWLGQQVVAEHVVGRVTVQHRLARIEPAGPGRHGTQLNMMLLFDNSSDCLIVDRS